MLMFHVSDLSDFQRFLYDETHQISDFIEKSLIKIARSLLYIKKWDILVIFKHCAFEQKLFFSLFLIVQFF